MTTTAPTATGTCPACAKPITAGAERCTHCGIALGEHQRCVHCRAIVDVDTLPEARFACRLCGGVRIPIDDPAITRSDAQIELLKKATIARSAATVWSIVATAVAAFGVVTVLVLALVLSFAEPPTAAAVMAGLAASTPFAFAALAFAKSRKHRGEIGHAVEAAWMAAAGDIARARGGEIDAGTFAKLTRASENAAAQILERMSSQGLFASSATSDGSHKYTIRGADSDVTRALASGK
jgi:hypothetical protein